MSQMARLDKLWPLLSAKERGILVLKSLKTGEPEDYRIRTTMPNHQIPEFNRYIDLMNRVNTELNLLVGVLKLMEEKLELKMAWLGTLYLWSAAVARLWRCVENTKEPITETEYAELRAAEEQKLIPLSEAAETAAELREEEDEESADTDDEDAAWDRAVHAWAERLAAAVRCGQLEGMDGPDGLQVRAGAFYTWLGESIPLYPDNGCGYEVRPDAEAKLVEGERRLRSSAAEALKDSPSPEWTFGYASEYAPAMRDRNGASLAVGDQVAKALTEAVSKQLAAHWAELRTVEIVMAEVAAEFDGEDPARPKLREEINALKGALCQLKAKLTDCLGSFEFEEPTDKEIELTRKLARGDIRVYK